MLPTLFKPARPGSGGLSTFNYPSPAETPNPNYDLEFGPLNCSQFTDWHRRKILRLYPELAGTGNQTGTGIVHKISDRPLPSSMHRY